MEATGEKAREEEQRRLQAEVEAEAERVRHDAEERRVEQEWREQEEEVEARCRRSHLESTLTSVAAPVAALETELPRSKGKGLELAPESEGVQELQRCDSCEKRDVECVWNKVSLLLVVKTNLLTTLQTGWSCSCRLCQELRIRCSTGGGVPVRWKRAWEEDRGEGPSKRVRVAKGPELEMESSTQQELLEEVAEANWLLRKIWQSVEGVQNQTRRMAAEAERVEVRRELEELQEEAEGHCDESSEDSESLGLWRTELGEPEERESEKWRSTVDLESEKWRSTVDLESEGLEGSEPEVEKEVEKEVEEEMTLQ